MRVSLLKRLTRAIPKAEKKILKSDFWNGLNTLQSNSPKGFGKFFSPEGATSTTETKIDDKKSNNDTDKKTESTTDTKKADNTNESKTKFTDETDKSKNNNSGNNKNNKNNKKNDEEWTLERIALFVIVGTGVSALTLSASDYMSRGKEISWQEFQSVLLESGQVDRLVIVNKQYARYANLF